MSAAVPDRAPASVPTIGAQLAAEVVTVDPELAREWLGRNTRNRVKKPRKIEQYARDMAEGRWQLTGESIKFGTDGRLLDGQNRLQALIQADTSVTFLVVRNVKPQAQDVMDSGVARTVADALSMAGVENAQRSTGAARIALCVRDGVRINSARFSNSEVQEWVFDNLDITEVGRIVPQANAKLIPLPPAVRVYCIWRLMQVDDEAAIEFFEQLATGVGIKPNSAVTALKRRLAGDYGSTRRITPDEQITAVFRAWNAWRQDKPMERIQTTDRTGRGRIPDPI